MKSEIRITTLLTFCFLIGAGSLRAQGPEEIAPGVAFSRAGGVALLDTSGAAPKAVVVHATEIKSNAHAGSNFARGMVYSGPHSTVELDGTTASLILTSSSPAFYIRLPAEDPDTQRNRITLLRLRPTKDTRVVLDFSQNVFGGSRKRHTDEIAIVKTDVDDGAWVRMTPLKPLEPGEYGITFLPKDQMLFSDTVYDFSVSTAK
jgi:hypothetical protein